MGWMVWGLIPSRSKRFTFLQYIQTGSVAHQASYSRGNEHSFSWGESGHGTKVTHHNLVARLRKNEAIPPLLLHAFMT